MKVRRFFVCLVSIALSLPLATGVPQPGSLTIAASAASTANAHNVELVGHIGGSTYDVAVQGNYAYIGEGPRLTILDISDPSSPSLVGKTPPLPALTQGIYVAAGYVYVADSDAGLRVVDISNPVNPIEVGFYDTPEYACDVVVVEDYAYLANSWSGLWVVDISDPTQPTREGVYDTPGGAVGVAIAGGYAYVADGWGGLRIVDISDPANPTEVGSYSETLENFVRVAVAGDYVYIADAGFVAGLRVVNISNPANPTEVGFHSMEDAEGVTVAGGYAYVAAWLDGLRVMDVADPANPTEVGSYDTPGGAYNVAIAGDYAYVADYEAGLRVVDVSNPANPTEIGFYYSLGYVWDVTVAGDYAYVADYRAGLRVVNVSNPANPVAVGFYDTPGDIEGTAVAGDYAYVIDAPVWTDGQYVDGGLWVVDVSNPANPIGMGFYDTPGYSGGGVTIAGDHAYVADAGLWDGSQWAGGGLCVVDVSNPANPTETGFYDTPGNAEDVAVAGDYAYVADYNSLRVVDISNPASPTAVGSCDTPEGASDVAIAGEYAYVANGDAGLRVVDVSNPTNPTEAGYYDTPERAEGVAVAGSYAYIADGYGGLLRVVDVSDPADPTEVGSYDTPGYVAHDVAVAENYVYVADEEGGLFILRFIDISSRTYLPLVFRNWECLPQPNTPNDTYYAAYQWNLPQVRAPYAWAVSTGSSDAVVAVLDTGADMTHPDLQGKFVAGWDFVHNGAAPDDDEGHGTHVAGIVAAITNNSRGVAGVSWGSRIMPVKVLDQNGEGTHSQVANGITWATDHGARVVNLSLGGEDSSTTLQNAINYAYSRGVLVVAAAGNEYQEGNPVIYPAAYPHVLAVAATGDEDEHARYSETGYYVDVAAPGGNPTSSWDSNPNHWIMSTYWRGAGFGEYMWIVGTSQATPHVAGLAALVWSVNPSLSNDQVEQIIEETAVDVGTPGRDDVFGYGRIDTYRALARASYGALAAEPERTLVSLPPVDTSLSPVSRVPVHGTESTRGEFAAGVVLVKFRSGVRQETIASVLGRYSVQVTDRIPALGVLHLSVPVGAEIDVSERLSQDPAVEYAEPDYLVQAFRVE